MPISVTCPSCSAAFKVKDEYAGKRAKCPKCAEPLTIPAAAVGPTDTVKMPPGAFPARPVVASKPKPAPVPVDDEADEAPKSKRRRNDDEDAPISPKRKRGAEDEDDAPVSPKRKRGASDVDETPKGKRRRRDDDEPRKKGKALPIILGIVGGVLLLCGGGCAGVWFGVIVPAAEQAKKRNDETQAAIRRADDALDRNPAFVPRPVDQTVSEGNLGRVQSGMKLSEVESFLGIASTAYDTHIYQAALGAKDPTTSDRWLAKEKQGHLVKWSSGTNIIVLALSEKPGLYGTVTVVGALARIDGRPSEPIQLAGGTGGGTPTGGGKPVTPGNMALVNVGMTYAQVEAIFGPGKFAEEADMVRLTNGAASNANWMAKKNEGSVVVWGNQTNTIQVAFTAPNGGTVVGVRGLFGKDNAEPVPLPAAAVVVTAAALVKEWDANPAAAEAKYKDKGLKVTGVVAEIPKEAVSFSFQGANPPTTKAAIAMPVNVPFGGWGPIKKLKVGDTVTVTCKFDSFAKNKNNVWELKLKDAVFVPK